MLQKIFDILATGLNVLHNFDNSTNYFSDLYSTKILAFFQQNRSFRVVMSQRIQIKLIN